MSDEPHPPADDREEIKPSASGHWAAVAFLAALFIAVVLFVEVAERTAGGLEERLVERFHQEVEKIFGKIDFSFESFTRTIGSKVPGKRLEPRRAVNRFPPLDFEKNAPKLRLQIRGESTGTFRAARDGDNGALKLALLLNNPNRGGDSRYDVSALIDLEVALRTTELTGVSFMVKGSGIANYGFSIWSLVDGRWYRHSVHGLHPSPEWRNVTVDFKDTLSMIYDDRSGKYIPHRAGIAPDYIFWIGWHFDPQNGRKGESAELYFDDVGFY